MPIIARWRIRIIGAFHLLDAIKIFRTYRARFADNERARHIEYINAIVVQREVAGRH